MVEFDTIYFYFLFINFFWSGFLKFYFIYIMF